MEKMKTITVNGSTYQVSDPEALSFVKEQLLSEEQKILARKNIGAAAVDESGGYTGDSVLYTAQEPTPEQQAQARDNIGAADRNDVEILLTKTDPCVLTKDSVFFQGYLSGNDFIATSGSNAFRTSDFVELERGVVYQCDYEGTTIDGTIKTYPRTIAFYDADKNITRGASLPSDMSNLQLEEGEVYLRLNYSEPQVNVLRIYPKYLGYEPITKFNPELEIPQVEEVREDIDEIREEIEQIKSSEQSPENLGVLLTETDPCVLTKDSVFYKGYLSGNEFIEATGASAQRTSDFIELEPGIVYQCEYEGVTSSGTVKTYPRTIVLYNAEKTVSRSVQQSDMARFYLDGNEKYLRLNYNDPQVNILRVYPKHLGYEPITTLNPELEVPQIKTELKRNEGNYIHARRPIIAFIFDGEYDRNAEMEAKFSQHNMRVGFAPQYNTTFPNNPASTYLAWQKKGHEILAHGQYVLNGDRYTEEQGKQYIQKSYERLSKYGFNIHGYIGCEGKVDEKYLPTIKRYYDYAATENNGSGDGTKSTFYFGTHNPYQLWRFSLASSTPAQCMDAVDHAMNTGGLLLFYAHARSTDNNHLTLENLETLLTHIEAVGAIVKTPYEAIKDFFSIRYEDFINQN